VRAANSIKIIQGLIFMFKAKIADQFLRTLEKLEYGALQLVTPEGKTYAFEGKQEGPAASLQLTDWQVIKNFALNGDIGFAQDYRDKKWDTPDLVALLQMGLKNHQSLNDYILGSGFMRFLTKISYLFRLNTLKGSRKNIHAHYDLGNSFYQLWLDETMTYSSALFYDNESLSLAQQHKYDLILDRFKDHSGSILEIGCGWGGFMQRAFEKGDYTIKGLTLSTEQHAFAKQRLQSHSTQANIALEDYRLQEGTYQNIVSIEMFEAVGEKYWETYFQKIKQLLAKEGKAVIQSITIKDSFFEIYRNGGDFIRSFIFPGGMLPSPNRFKIEAEKTGLKCNTPFFFGGSYAKTLEVWLNNFDAQTKNVKTLGFDDGFIRLWRFYLAACAASFKVDRTNVMQIELSHA
jgi:cyclopropane-fatty-acyl-phospholipid synthase